MEHTVDSPQQRAPRLVVEHDDHTRGRQGWAAPKCLLYASEGKREKNRVKLLELCLERWSKTDECHSPTAIKQGVQP